MPQPNPRDTYRQIAEQLRTELTGTSKPPGSRLPSEAELCSVHGVSRTTVRRALRALGEEGLIESVPGVGWRLRTGERSAPTAGVPLYRSVMDALRKAIADGVLSVGDPVPSEGELSEKYEVSRPTVRRALAELEGAGLLETRHGRGRFVRGGPQSTTNP